MPKGNKATVKNTASTIIPGAIFLAHATNTSLKADKPQNLRDKHPYAVNYRQINEK
jgi:hypothetical protein